MSLSTITESSYGKSSTIKQDSHSILKRFWPKIRRTLGRVPFVDLAIAAYYCAIDPNTPRRVQVLLLGALAYFIAPADTIPDFVIGLGFTDDYAVLAIAINLVQSHIKECHRQAAQFVIEGLKKAPNNGGNRAN